MVCSDDIINDHIVACNGFSAGLTNAVVNVIPGDAYLRSHIDGLLLQCMPVPDPVDKGHQNIETGHQCAPVFTQSFNNISTSLGNDLDSG